MSTLLSAAIQWSDFYEAILVSGVNTLLMFFASFKFVQTMQQSGYDGKDYSGWLKRKDNIYMMRLVIVSFLSVLAFLIFNIAIMIFVDEDWVRYIGFVFYLFFFVIYIKKDRSVKSKVPLAWTNRATRLIVTFVILTFLLGLLGLSLVNLAASFGDPATLLFKLRYGLICLSPMALPVLVLFAYYINEPFERSNKRRYVEKCKQRLAEYPSLIKIGITGSYGKTSVKKILHTILSQKYNVLSTPFSYNTPMGICKTVKSLTSSHEVLIAEMGARKVGDIRELTDIVRPDIAVMTGVIGQHIETFGSISNVKKTKYELIEGLKENGFAVFSADNENTVELMQKCPKTHFNAGLNTNFSPIVTAENVKITGVGTRFTLVLGEQKIECSTVLLGTHNVSNICLAAAVALKLGLTPAEISAGINAILPIKRRLEITENSRGLTLIDDSYNANVNGTIAAMEVLDCFEGRKIVITPGLIELGESEEFENYQFGKRLGTHADKVILVGKRRIDKIKQGLISVDFPEEDIYTVKDLDEGTELFAKIAQRGDVVIFENDLPDKYN